jgi:hypothetical protein
MTTDSHHQDSLQKYLTEIRSIWGDGKDPQLPFRAKGQLEKLLTSTNPQESWIATLIREGLLAKGLYRDKDYGFILMGHIHEKGYTTSPEDNGSCWILYDVYHGVTEITTYRRTDDGIVPGQATLEEKELQRLTPGVVVSYLSGEILSTLVVEHSVVFRFLSSDLNQVQRFRYVPDGINFRPIAMKETHQRSLSR